MSMSNEVREIIVKNAYSPSVPYRLRCGDGMAKQSFKEECDINTILKKYDKTGLIEHVSKYNGSYGDVTESVDYQTALNTVMSAESAFMSLPASIRTLFDNDPHRFLEFAQDPENAEELIEMGLATRAPKRAAETDELGETPEGTEEEAETPQ